MVRRVVALFAIFLCALALPVAPAAADPKIVYLTFDDGPNPANDRPLLDLLARKHVPATFFLVGTALQADPRAATDLWLAGHAIGNHTYSHHSLTAMSPFGVDHELTRMQALMGPGAGGCMRPPYGAINATVTGRAKALGLTPVMWSIDPQDWARQDSDYIVNHVLSRVQNRSVLLLHDGGGLRPATVNAVRKLIPRLRARGFEMRTIPSCRVPLKGRAEGMALIKQPRIPPVVDEPQ